MRERRRRRGHHWIRLTAWTGPRVVPFVCIPVGMDIFFIFLLLPISFLSSREDEPDPLEFQTPFRIDPNGAGDFGPPQR